MRDYILIYVNGRRHEVRSSFAFTSLSTFLREHLRLIGTKIVCSEGDCGSCTILLGKPQKDTLAYRPVCSCIQFLYQLDCTHIITIEGLKYEGQLNPVQESMVRNQGSQCGFCTPGFVVSMCALLDKTPTPTDHQFRRGLVGNLCRCTGYESILKAGLDIDAKEMRPITSLYRTTEIAKDLSQHENETVEISADDKILCKPSTIEEAIAFRKAHPDCTIISGGTDLGVQVNKGVREINTILSTRSLRSLHAIEIKEGKLIVGACATIAELETAALQHLPEYGRMLAWFGSPPIKHAGTIGGNIANGSPIADSMPALYVLNGEIELTGSNGARRINMNDFYTGYKRSVMTPDELITRVHIPLPAPGDTFKVYKISKRKDLDISAFTAAFWMRTTGALIDDVRIAFGGVGPNIIRLKKTEDYLRGQPLVEEIFRQAGQLARSEIRPISDMRGSADFRLQLAENILLKFLGEISEPRTPDPVTTGSNGKGTH